MLYTHNSNKSGRPVPAVIWSIHPISQIITVRPAWDLYTKLILPRSLDEYYKRGHFYTLAKLIRQSGLYPHGTKYVQVARNVLAFFRKGQFVHLGQNVIVDPWYDNAQNIVAINYYNPWHEYNEIPKFYGRK